MKKKFEYSRLDSSDDDSQQYEFDDEIPNDQKYQRKASSNSSFSLKRNVTVLSGITLVVGNVIGSGIFIVPSSVLQTASNNVCGCLLAWFLAGVLTMFVALCFCELATLMPKSGGVLNYLQQIFGDGVCFIACWMLFFTAFPQGAAVQTIALGNYVLQAITANLGVCFSPTATSVGSKLVGMIIVLFLAYLNVTNVQLTLKIQVICTVGKVMGLLLIFVSGMVYALIDSSTLVANFNTMPVVQDALNSSSSLLQTTDEGISSSLSFLSLNLAVFNALWAYEGFDCITCITEEVKNPKKNLPLIIITSILIIVSLYMAVNISFFSVLTNKEISRSNAVAVDFAARIHPMLVNIVTLSVCLSVMGSANAGMMAATRMIFATARMGFLPKIFAMVHIEYFTPTPAILIFMFLSGLMLFMGNLDSLITAVLFNSMVFRCMVCFGILVLRKTMAHCERPYKVYLTTALLAGGFLLYIYILPVVFQPNLLYIYSLVLFIVFFLFYLLYRTGRISFNHVGRNTLLLQKLLCCAKTDDVND